MRTLRFKVDGQTIDLDPNCDFSGLIPGSEGVMQAEFIFSKEWDGYTKVAAFFSNLGHEYEPQIIQRNMTCKIPVEALQRGIFKVQVVGQRKDMKMRTNKVAVHQRGGNV